ncbi:hypothetical protein [Streptomyces sp. NPDC002133]|uniref:hypothetical protein n=1 Tax=Streptomyces sp. NPDC002133 TaxID=3154409 RepID=UPI003326C857
MAARFTDSQIQARTFAPLVLDMIVSRGDFRQSWLDAFATWFAAETDLQSYDPVLGWLRAGAGFRRPRSSASVMVGTTMRWSAAQPSVTACASG